MLILYKMVWLQTTDQVQLAPNRAGSYNEDMADILIYYSVSLSIKSAWLSALIDVLFIVRLVCINLLTSGLDCGKKHESANFNYV